MIIPEHGGSRTPSTVPFVSGNSLLAKSRQSADSAPCVVATGPICNPAQHELTAELLAKARGISPRNARSALAHCPVIRRATPPSGGRPTNIYKVSDDARLVQTAERIAAEQPACDIWASVDAAKTTSKAVASDDLRIAQLRMQAVSDVRYWISVGMSEHESVHRVCAEWVVPQQITLRTTLRSKAPSLGGGFHQRGRVKKTDLSVGGFSPRTLREWVARADAAGKDAQAQLAALAPQRKGKSGRRSIELPHALCEIVFALLVGSCRADLSAALTKARTEWQGEFPRVSKDTWRRRMAAMDPAGALRTLATKGVAKHQWEHTPDISIDRSKMGWNAEWTLDDVTQDWYAVNAIENEVFRPRLYVLQRIATRQWICAVASIDPITSDQVRAMVGSAMASESGGIPLLIIFENGFVACDETLANLLRVLGVKVRRNSMIGGSVVKGATPDRASGNFPGKSTIESAIKQLHRYFIYQPGQTGSNERLTAPARLQTMKAEAEAAAKAGTVLLFPTQDEMHAIVRSALNAYNDAPHGGLPQIVDPATGMPRHASPNEWAKHLRGETVQVLEPQFLQLFHQRGSVIRVSRNGIRVQNEFYGRFDDDVQALAGTNVHVHQDPNDPSAIFVQELNRCVERYDRPQPGDDRSEQFAAKARVTRAHRNQLEAHFRAAIQSGSSAVLESLQFTGNPTPDRAFARVAPAEFARRLAEREAASRVIETQRAERAQADAERGSFQDQRREKYAFAE